MILRALYRFLLVLLSVSSVSALALAGDEPVGNAPRDVPMSVVGLEIPALPSNFETRSVDDWLTVSYPAGMGERMEGVLADAPSFKAELEERFAQPILLHAEVRLARTPEELAELSPRKSPPPAYAVGVAYPSVELAVLCNVEPHTYEGANLVETFRHEMVHLALNDAVQGRHVPLWFNEGISVVFSGERSVDRMSTLENASLSGTLLPLAELDRNFPPDFGVNVAYAESADFTRFLMRDEDRGRFSALISRVRGDEAFDRALGDAYGSDTRKLEYQWRDNLSSRFTVWPAILGGSLLWVAAIGVMIAAWVRRRRKAKATLARWAEEEAAQERMRRALIAAVRPEEPQQEFASTMVQGELPRVEHDGDWHTLH